MVDQWTDQSRVPVSFDENRQAMGSNSVNFNSFCGTLAKWSNILPSTNSDWREVLPSLKDDGSSIFLLYTNIKLL